MRFSARNDKKLNTNRIQSKIHHRKKRARNTHENKIDLYRVRCAALLLFVKHTKCHIRRISIVCSYINAEISCYIHKTLVHTDYGSTLSWQIKTKKWFTFASRSRFILSYFPLKLCGFILVVQRKTHFRLRIYKSVWGMQTDESPVTYLC